MPPMCHATVSHRLTFAIVVERWAALANQLSIASSRHANATCMRTLSEHIVKVVGARHLRRLWLPVLGACLPLVLPRIPFFDETSPSVGGFEKGRSRAVG